MELTWIEATAVPPGPRVQYSPVRNHCSVLPHSDLAALAQSSRPRSPILRFVQRGPAHSAVMWPRPLCCGARRGIRPRRKRKDTKTTTSSCKQQFGSPHRAPRLIGPWLRQGSLTPPPPTLTIQITGFLLAPLQLGLLVRGPH